MRAYCFIIVVTAGLASAKPQYSISNPHEWMAPGPNDFRGPCPMMNTLANHGFLPRSGRNITKPNAINALHNGINFAPALASLMWDQAIIANPQPNATFFTLDHLNRHNVLEHDASLSRTDAFLGNNHIFNQTIFDESRMWWTDTTVSAKQLAHSKIYRQLRSRAMNPEYRFTANTEEFSLGEVAAPIIVFGDMRRGVVEKSLVEFFFQNERLPTELGWHKKHDEITLEDILGTTAIVRNATSLLTGTATNAPHKRRLDLHTGLEQ